MYSNVPISQRAMAAGKQPIGGECVDVSKQDDEHQRYTPRLGANEIRRTPEPECYAATPFPECLRMIISDAMVGLCQADGVWRQQSIVV